MGIDIHWVFQRKMGDGSYEDVPSLYKGDRHYALFSWLGFETLNSYGITPLTVNQGVPNDFLLNDIDEDGDGDPTKNGEYHNMVWVGEYRYSWINIHSILERELAEDLRCCFDYFFKELERLNHEYGECRMVFGFDG